MILLDHKAKPSGLSYTGNQSCSPRRRSTVVFLLPCCKLIYMKALKMLAEVSGLKQSSNPPTDTHTHTLRPLWGGLLSPEIIPRRWWWVWSTFMSIFFSVLPGSDINVLLLRLLFLRAFALPQVFAKAHQQTSYYSASAEREARGLNVEIQKRKEID